MLVENNMEQMECFGSSFPELFIFYFYYYGLWKVVIYMALWFVK